MPPEIPFDPHRFRTTAPFYARYRQPYPERLIARVIDLTGLKPGARVLDLGCGPGPLAVAFARAGMKVTAVDPEPEMLAQARAQAQAAEVAIDFRQGSSFDLPADIGPLDLVTMGRAFHWMDRAATLALLDTLVVPGGALACFEDEHPKTAENRWYTLLDEVSARFGAEEFAHRAARRQSDYRAHVSFLLDSPFRDIESVGVMLCRRITADDILGLAFSRSVTAPQRLGERAAAFEAELRRELAVLSPGGVFAEIADMQAMVARRL
jgi:ubiquinone/menaquinone biosynthesis C-methylase UbiE